MTRPSRWWVAGLVGGVALLLAGSSDAVGGGWGSLTQRLGHSAEWVFQVPAAHAAAASCVGDCDHNTVVTDTEILATLSISLGTAPPSACGGAAATADGAMTVEHVLRAINAGEYGCAGSPEPTVGQSTPLGNGGLPTPTTTPVPPGSSRNERTSSNAQGSITLRLNKIQVLAGQLATFSVFLRDAAGRPAVTEPIDVTTAAGLTVASLEPPDSVTRTDGTVSGTAGGFTTGAFVITAKSTSGRFGNLSVSLTLVVFGVAPTVPSANTPTGTLPPPATPTATPTATAKPCDRVQTIIVQTDTLNVSGQVGGLAGITAVVFDGDNLPVEGVNVLFDVQPRVASFRELVQTTDRGGTAATGMSIPAGSSFGELKVAVSACGVVGNVSVNVVSGTSGTKPVQTVVLQANPSSVGSQSGGTINLKAAALDADNQPINGIDVLFITSIGGVNPLIDRTKAIGSEGGIATSVVEVPSGAVEDRYTISALAGGVQGSVIINVVPGLVPPGGQVKPGVPPGEPAGLTLGASPTRLQVAGTGGTELSTVVARVIDNNGNPLAGARVYFHVVAAQSAAGAVILPQTSPTPSGSPVPVPETRCPPDDPYATSDVAGFALIQVRSGSAPGTVTVSACADTTILGVPSPLVEQQALVTVTSGPVGRLNVAINPRSIDNNDGALTTTASAIVIDGQGNTVEDGTPVFFELITRHLCTGGGNDGGVCVTGGDCPGGACVTDLNDPARNVSISSNTATNALPPCDVSQYIVQTGIPVTSQPGNAITCLKFPFTQQATEVRIRATAAGVSNGLLGQAGTLPGHVGDLEASANPSTVRVSATSDGLAVVRAFVYDAELAPVENVRVRFSSSVGTIDRSVLSDADGVAEATLVIPAGTASGSAAVRVSGGGLVLPNITVSIVNTGGGVTPTPNLTPGVTPGQPAPASVQFIGADLAIIGVRGSGLPEQSVLTFRVTDARGEPVTEVPVDFAIARVADESIEPKQGVTDDAGEVEVTLTSGQRALSVQVTAQVKSVSPALLARSTAVNILGGPPSQPNFSLAHEFHNISGRVSFGLVDRITAFVADRFGNPVPPGTAVSFTTRGGAIGNPTVTSALGQATASLVSQAPVPASGIVNTLATTAGERPFVDRNGNGVCDGDDELVALSEPFYDMNCNRVFDDGDDFIDLNANGQFDRNQGDGTPACGDQLTVFESICTTFSGPTATLLLPAGGAVIEAGGGQTFTLIVSDNPDPIGNPGVGNPIVGGSTLNIELQKGGRARLVGPTSFTLPDAFTNNQIVDGINRFHFTVIDDQPTSATPAIDALVVTVTSKELPAGGNGSVALSVPIVLLGYVTPTPSRTPAPPTATATWTPTPTPTLEAGQPTPTPVRTATQTPTVPVGSIAFVSAEPATIGVRGSGLPEQSLVTFKARNTQGNPIAGAVVTFELTGSGSELLDPPTAITGPTGLVSTTVTSGVRATTVRVTATADSTGDGLPDIVVQSQVVSILGAPPAVNHFSVAPALRNVAGRVTYGLQDTISAFVNDRFGNAVPPSTAVSFLTNAASVVSPTTTNSAGVATATLLSEGLVPPSGIVTVLAFTRGEESFLDNNGNGRFDCTGTTTPPCAGSGIDSVLTDAVPEPFIDFRPLPPADASCSLPAPSPLCNNRFDINIPFELFVDGGALNGLWDAQGTPGVWDNNIFVSASTVVTFSGPLVTPQASPTTFTIANGGSQGFTLDVHDDLRNPLVGGSTIAVSVSGGQVVGGDITIPDGHSFNQFVPGLTRFGFVVADSDPADTDPPAAASVVVKITSPNGTGTFVVASGTID